MWRHGGDADFEPQRYRVRTVAIDDCLTELGIARVDIVKMDIEGAELAALRGMRRTIADSPGLALVMEYNPAALRAFGHEPVAALDEARGLGFGRIEAIEADGSLTDWGDPALVERETARLLADMGVVNLLLCGGRHGIFFTTVATESESEYGTIVRKWLLLWTLQPNRLTSTIIIPRLTWKLICRWQCAGWTILRPIFLESRKIYSLPTL